MATATFKVRIGDGRGGAYYVLIDDIDRWRTDKRTRGQEAARQIEARATAHTAKGDVVNLDRGNLSAKEVR
jgi:hypothetical protein